MGDPELGEESGETRPQTPEDGLDPVIDHELSSEEKRFLLFAERGDVASVAHDLERTKLNNKININCTDPLGRTALVIAIDNENQEMMELLLNAGAEPRDSLLHAISEDYVEGVEYLLSWEEANHQKGEPYSWERIDERVATFTPEITPLIMAAQRNNYEVLKLLLDRGATLPLPHDVKCGCDECVLSQQQDGLRHSRSRITAYQALACPSLICLSSRDPILSAFELSAELRKLSSIDTEFKTEYVGLRKNVQHFAESLVDHTRKSLELEIMLNYDPEGGAYVPGERMHFERLKTAIRYRQKEFISHPNVQQLLGTVWYDGMPGFRRKAMLGQLLEVAQIGTLFPVYASMYMAAPHSSWAHHCRKPFVKFIIHSSSYMFFLFLLVMVSQRMESTVVRMFGTEGMVERQDEYERKARGAVPTYIEMLVIFYIFAFLWAEIKQLWENGLADYLGDMWNVVDFGTNWFYVNWIGLRATAFIIVWREQSAGIDPWRPKEQWHPYDPMFISEGMYGAANIFSFLKLIHILSVNQHLGPLQISLGRMVFDIIKFMCIVMLVVFSFGCGLNQMLWYYADMDKGLCYSGPGGTPNEDYENSCQIWRRFSNLFETSQSLFWAVFGLVDLENFELTGIQEFTRFWTLLMFGSYSAINIVVLLNLLIAMMSNSYNIIFERSDLEWKFARSKLWMSYFEDGSTLPPPFNIIPTPKSFIRLFGIGKTKQAASFRKKDQQKRDKQYYSVMRALVRRYVTFEQKKLEDTGVTEDDINEVKQDINSFKYQLLDVLRKNGMTVGNSGSDDKFGVGRKQQQKERRLIKGFNIGLVENA
ncbi:transient receptor potential-gamma protein-like [Pollicipes pollicipes]|uniref:transient receptor potential-gamma protein-like n=1 Tax=Pollicipes pollicipes TaxID=41117 RepID=UPI0018855111|nr:transient receptor potential-gamma protein-like [Pollicipes pollicipes]